MWARPRFAWKRTSRRRCLVPVPCVDIRELDGERLLESEDVGDNVIAILTRLRDHRDAVRRIVERIAGLMPAERATALGQLLILAWPSALGRNCRRGGAKDAYFR